MSTTSEQPAGVPAHWQPGAIISGRFRVIRVLGIGGMGAVLEAENLGLGQRVALKVLRSELIDSREAQARLDQEARVVSQLHTDHVARVHDLGRTEQGEPFIVMELLAGRTIDDLIESPEPVSIELAVDLTAEACVGLAVAHAAGLVHRDIKPANLFVAHRADGSELVKVLDFGLIKVTRSDELRLTASATVFGTPLYMSPEQIMSAKRVDARSDQHAMAMVLFELLTKTPPYLDESPTAVTVKIATSPPPSVRAWRPDVPEGLDAVIRKALGKAPNDRYDDIALFALAIAAFGSDRAMSAAKRAALALNRAPVVPEPPAIVTRARGPETVSGLTTRRRIEGQKRTGWSALAIGGAAIAGVAATVVGYRLVGPGSDPVASSATPVIADASAQSNDSDAAPGAAPATSASTTTSPPLVVPATAASSAAAGTVAGPSSAPVPLPSSAKTGKSPTRPAPATSQPASGEFIPTYRPGK